MEPLNFSAADIVGADAGGGAITGAGLPITSVAISWGFFCSCWYWLKVLIGREKLMDSMQPYRKLSPEQICAVAKREFDRNRL